MPDIIQDNLVIVSRNGFIFDPKETGIGLTQIDLSKAAGFNNTITAAYADPLTDKLYFVHSGNKLAIWNTGFDNLEYEWVSKVYQLPYHTAMLAAQVKVRETDDNCTFKAFCDGNIQHTKNITKEEEFVLPSTLGRSQEVQIGFFGTGTLKGAEIAETMEELG